MLMRLMMMVLALVSWYAALAWTQGFQDETLRLPLQTYGIANEPCERANVRAGDLLLSTRDRWQTALESPLHAGKRIFLKAGTYTIAGGVTGRLDLANATAAAPTTIKPQNCAAVTIRGRTRPCNYHILAGLDFYHYDVASQGEGAAIEFNRQQCTGSMIRNNLIRSEGSTTINFHGSTSVINTDPRRQRYPQTSQGRE